VVLLILRVVAGTAFMFHGWSKIQTPFGWMGPDSSMPSLLQALAALSEFGGGLAWVLGLLTPLASAGILSTMAVAFWTHAIVRGDPFVGKGPSYELALVYASIAALLMVGGPGRISLDALIAKRVKDSASRE
jgi:putative oxidoreductase